MPCVHAVLLPWYPFRGIVLARGLWCGLPLTRQVMHALPAHAQNYVVMRSGPSGAVRDSVWYVEDEVGHAVSASDTPNAAVALLLCVTQGVAFSLLTLTADAAQGLSSSDLHMIFLVFII